MLLFAEVRISVTRIHGYEDDHGFPYPKNYLEIGSAMLSLVCCYQLATNGSSKRPHRPIAAGSGKRCSYFLEQQQLLIIISLFIQHHSRSISYNPVATADERLKQRLREVSLCPPSGGATAVSQRVFSGHNPLIVSFIVQFQPQYHQLRSTNTTA